MVLDPRARARSSGPSRPPTGGPRRSPRRRSPASRPPASITRPSRRAGAVEVRRVVRLPRAGRRRCRPARRAAQQDAVARAVAVLARVELDEVGAGLVLLADEDGDAEHRLGRVEQLVRAARALRARMKPTRSAPASTATSTSSWRVRPQTLTSGRESSSASFAPGSGARISVEPTSIAFAPASSAAAPCARVCDRRTRRSRSGRAAHAASSASWRAAVDLERREVAGVDADHGRAERGRARELVGVVRLDERVEPERSGLAASARAQAASSRSRRSSSAASAPASRAVAQVLVRWRRSPWRAAAARSPPAPRAGRPRSRRTARRRAPTSPAPRPARSARATAATSPPGRRSPADGERRLNSAIAPNPAPRARREPHAASRDTS